MSKKCIVGYGFDVENPPFMGPLVSANAVENYVRYQGIALREGCEEVMRGKPLERKQSGHYVSPSIHLMRKTDSKSVYETSEIFGPNLAIYSVKDFDQVLETLGNAHYGLVTSLYSKDKTLFEHLVRDVSVGRFYRNLPTTFNTEAIPYVATRKSGSCTPLGSETVSQCHYPVCAVEGQVPYGVKGPLPTVG